MLSQVYCPKITWFTYCSYVVLNSSETYCKSTKDVSNNGHKYIQISPFCSHTLTKSCLNYNSSISISSGSWWAHLWVCSLVLILYHLWTPAPMFRMQCPHCSTWTWGREKKTYRSCWMVHQSLVTKPSLGTAPGGFEMKSRQGMKMMQGMKLALCCCIATSKGGVSIPGTSRCHGQWRVMHTWGGSALH